MGRCRLGGRGVSIRYPNIKSTYASFAVLRQALTGGINAPLKRSHLSSFIRISLHLLHTVLDIYCCLYCLMGGIASVFAIWACWPLRKELHSRKQWKGRDGHSYGRTQQDWPRGRDGVFVSLLVKVHTEKKEKYLEIPKPHGLKIITSWDFQHLEFLFCTKLSLDWNWYRTLGGILHCGLGRFLMCVCLVCVSSCETQERTTLRRVSLQKSQLFLFHSVFKMRHCMIRVLLQRL